MRALLTLVARVKAWRVKAWRERRIRERIQRMQDRTQREREEPAPPEVIDDEVYQQFCEPGLPPVDRKAVPPRPKRKTTRLETR